MLERDDFVTLRQDGEPPAAPRLRTVSTGSCGPSQRFARELRNHGPERFALTCRVLPGSKEHVFVDVESSSHGRHLMLMHHHINEIGRFKNIRGPFVARTGHLRIDRNPSASF